MRGACKALLLAARADACAPGSRSSSTAGFMRRMSRPFRSTALVSKETGNRGEGGEAAAAEPPPEGTLDQRFWSCPGNAGFRLRGKHYLQVGHALARARQRAALHGSWLQHPGIISAGLQRARRLNRNLPSPHLQSSHVQGAKEG